MTQSLHIAGLFAGAGGLDLGFEQAGFKVSWANEYDKSIWATYERNFPHTTLDRRSIVDVQPDDIPSVDGFVGGPPCQSWSEAGALRGINDPRGQLFWEYMRLLDAHKPMFFLAENVPGILFERHRTAFRTILDGFADTGYNVSYGQLNARRYGVPQDRKRVILVGYRRDLNRYFAPPKPDDSLPTLKDAIGDLESVLPAVGDPRFHPPTTPPNHEYLDGGFSPIFMSRNRVRSWDEPSFTIQAGGRHAPLHPQAPKMPKVDTDRHIFEPGSEDLYRRLTVRECARVQTFPDTHEFAYHRIADGYKMVGNAVPVELARRLAVQIALDLRARATTDGLKRTGWKSFSDDAET